MMITFDTTLGVDRNFGVQNDKLTPILAHTGTCHGQLDAFSYRRATLLMHFHTFSYIFSQSGIMMITFDTTLGVDRNFGVQNDKLTPILAHTGTCHGQLDAFSYRRATLLMHFHTFSYIFSQSGIMMITFDTTLGVDRNFGVQNDKLTPILAHTGTCHGQLDAFSYRRAILLMHFHTFSYIFSQSGIMMITFDTTLGVDRNFGVQNDKLTPILAHTGTCHGQLDAFSYRRATLLMHFHTFSAKVVS